MGKISICLFRCGRRPFHKSIYFRCFDNAKKKRESPPKERAAEENSAIFDVKEIWMPHEIIIYVCTCVYVRVRVIFLSKIKGQGASFNLGPALFPISKNIIMRGVGKFASRAGNNRESAGFVIIPRPCHVVFAFLRYSLFIIDAKCNHSVMYVQNMIYRKFPLSCHLLILIR